MPPRTATLLLGAGLLLLSIGLASPPRSSKSRRSPVSEKHPNWRLLSSEEEAVLVHRGTEPPFSGKYVGLHEDGTYRCRRCGAPLFAAAAKFDSGCGWPSFDDALDGAVTERPDPDGRRREIICARCGGHLGHVFRGEGFTAKDTRHCVNSRSLDFEASPGSKRGVATFAGGCFWGVEHHFERVPGVVSAESGYMGGDVANPSYEQVCTGRTGHAEVVQVVYDPSKTTYEALAKLFFEIHDPTQVDRQGPDLGPQYRSAIFVRSEAERATAEALIAQLWGKGLRVATRIEPAGAFYRAEPYHQDYYARTGKAPYCHKRTERF